MLQVIGRVRKDKDRWLARMEQRLEGRRQEEEQWLKGSMGKNERRRLSSVDENEGREMWTPAAWTTT